MEEKNCMFTQELSKRMIQLRFENDWLFKKKKQPWSEFHKILLEQGFPEDMEVKHVRKRWDFMYQTYKKAKREKNNNWMYYKHFEKYYGKTKVLDKYESWTDEWRLKLITCISEAKTLKMDFFNMWKTVELAMRSQDLPDNCCIQDIKGLWHHIRMTFNRKFRVRQRNGGESDWPLYDTMVEYCIKHEPAYLVQLESSTSFPISRKRKSTTNYFNQDENMNCDEYDFQWTKDITESFIQIRLQNDWLFRDRKWAWNDLLAIMVQEHGFPKLLTGREICRKWASCFSEYQKSKATNNKSWVYYNLFELYLGEGSLSLNPIVGWQEEWLSNLISARIDLDHLFKLRLKEQDQWREVEKRLRSIGLPLDHSLLELPEIWKHLLKTYRWKKKFADKGILTEQWPYFEAMAQYDNISAANVIKTQKTEPVDDQYDDFDYDDDIKLFDLKQKLEPQVKPKFELSFIEQNNCRSCLSEEGCVKIFEQKDTDGFSIAEKLKFIGDVQVEPTDKLPTLICLNCLTELENAFKFRRKCQNADKLLRNRSVNEQKIKMEYPIGDCNEQRSFGYENNESDAHIDNMDTHIDDCHDDTKVKSERKTKLKKKKRTIKLIRKKKKRVKKDKYEYKRICEICGRHTSNLKSHLDMHLNGKPYSCDVCDKKFKYKSGLTIHKAIHDPTPRKTCEVCGKTFHIVAQYRRHFVYHANERKFECDTCGKRFNTPEILKVHNRIHTDERPFTCSECGKTFRTAGCVSRHKRILHKIIKSQ